MVVAIDFRGLGEFVRLNPGLRTIDDFVESLIDAEFISTETLERCRVGVSFSSSENLEITLEGVEADDDEMFCGEESERLTALINNQSSETDEVVVRPPVLQFAGAAVSAPAVFEEKLLNGAPSVTSTLLPLVVFLSTVFALLF